jgi:ATP-dependent Clp protease ATP-binding subunit ClpB
LSKKILSGEVEKNHPVLVDVFDNVVVFRNENGNAAERKDAERKDYKVRS